MPKEAFVPKSRIYTPEQIELEILEYRQRRLTKPLSIELDYLESPLHVRLVQPGDYGPIRLEHDKSTPEVIYYVLTGSDMSLDGRFPDRPSWLRVLSRKEGVEMDREKGRIAIPVFDQVSANSINTALLPILAAALDEIHDPIAWPRSPSTDIPTYELDDGTEVIEEGKYGSIVLSHALSGSPRGPVRHLVYKLSGRKTPGQRFPGVPGWNRFLMECEHARYIHERKRWRFVLKDPDISRDINRCLFPLLKEIILSEHAFKSRKRTEHVLHKIRFNLEANGVDMDKIDAEIDAEIKSR